MPGEPKQSSSSVVRAFDFLDLVAKAESNGTTLTDLARASGLPVSTTYRYISTLLSIGALRKDQSGHLFLGLKMLTLSAASLETSTLRALARGHLEQLALVSGETVHLGQHSEQGVVYIDKIDSAKSVRLVSRVGLVVPHYCTAMGKAILASMEPKARAPYLAAATITRTPYTLTGAALDAELDLVTQQRWVVDEQENEDGVRCLGTAITSHTGELLGAVSISGPAGRFTRENCTDLAPALVAAADSIGRQASWPGRPDLT